jgi:hypothetical protein
MARRVLLKRKNKDERPFASWQRLTAAIGEYNNSELLDEPTNSFTNNAVFAEGNYIVYPGIYLNATELLNQLLEAVFLRDNTLPDTFKKAVNDGAGILLFMSDSAAKDLKHTRYLYTQQSKSVSFPDYNTFFEQLKAVTFNKAHLQEVCNSHNYEYAILQEFVLPINDQALQEEDPDKNIVLTNNMSDIYGGI